ncbi:MAG: hypothetical protein LC808_38480 [Actinobacteria bacterium]|nr:hypothetical protein [Actinomycetota bacterium]
MRAVIEVKGTGRLMAKRYKAWVIRWEWIGDHAAVADRFIAVLPPQLGGHDVKRFVERYYASHYLTPEEQLHYLVRRRDPNPFPGQFGSALWEDRTGRKRNVPWTGQVTCGDNPFIVAQLATNVHVQPSRGDEPGALAWEDVPLPHRRFERLP